MIQRGERLGVALESRQTFGISRERVGQDLDRHLPTKGRVGGPIDRAHSAFAPAYR